MTISRSTSAYLSILLAGATVIVMLAMTSAARSTTTCLSKPVTITGTPGDDHLSGTRGNDVIDAGEGEDVVQGKLGNDRVCGSGGDDELHGGEGRKDRLDGGDGDDFLDGRRGFDADRMFGGPGNDRIWGANHLNGGPGNDELEVISYSGDPHRDTLDGGTDVDSCVGDSGNDTLVNCE